MSKKNKKNETNKKPSLGTPKLGTPKTNKTEESKVNVAKLKKAASSEKKPKKSIGNKGGAVKKTSEVSKLGKKKSKGGVSMKNTGKRKAKVIATGPTGRPRALEYQLPKMKEANRAKMDAQLKRLRERKLVSKKVTSLIGVSFTKEHRGKKYTITGTKKGWFVKNGSNKPPVGPFTQLYGVACNLVDGPRDPYLFFKDELAKLRPAS